ncbi:MAG: PilZ domain-containing protein, partial [Planctomycetota bacterium]
MRGTDTKPLPNEHAGGPICQPLPLTGAERAQLLARIDREPAAVTIANRRDHPRLRYRGRDIVATIQHPGGGMVRSYVVPVDISEGGICILRNGFLHRGTTATLDIAARDNEVLSVTGQVAWCTQFYGRIHRVGLEFDAHIDPRLFVDPRVWEHVLSELGGGHDGLQGRVLAIEDQELDQELLRMYLEETSLEVLIVETVEAATSAIRGKLFDLILCDLNLGQQKGEEFIRDSRRH